MKNVIALILLISVILVPRDGVTSSVPQYMLNASNEFDIDIALLYAICTQESKCNPNAVNRNDGNKSQKSSGKVIHSIGLFQIQLPTARHLGFKGTYAKLRTPETNAYYAAKLLRQLYDKYTDTVKVISAYNAGEGAVDHWLGTKSKKLRNVGYIHMVLKNYVKFKLDQPLILAADDE